MKNFHPPCIHNEKNFQNICLEANVIQVKSCVNVGLLAVK